MRTSRRPTIGVRLSLRLHCGSPHVLLGLRNRKVDLKSGSRPGRLPDGSANLACEAVDQLETEALTLAEFEVLRHPDPVI